MNEINVDYYCPYCEHETVIVVEATGPNDYYVSDKCCPNCDAGIDSGNTHNIIYDAVKNHFLNQGEFYHDVNDLQ